MEDLDAAGVLPLFASADRGHGAERQGGPGSGDP
jgi:hypothetical protein